ncbi:MULTISPECIES: ATP-dependent helicase [Pseudanabaena]|jgi:DNA helicase II / ATP-dependent DNA helicase PcrA|uniref:ATP-dependent helicase n=1 Tax=Pseudanabaena TaxID=1152 RepID=UPI002479E691|nr:MULTISPECIES: ATP-dependent helicase [Pseudanabaena]MEA5488802.1 ATP-dependent helicase [Pseudanabaena sp. CCNP1317]WGS71242.1 ATP-dependent helicase [Pseudanabaena galeata CCNP1313]
MNGLSPEQSSIVYSPIGQAMQVLASAGSGKTRVLTERVRHIINNTKKDGVIALTFTNKAAEEMLNRLQDLEGVNERCWIATIHSVAQRILEQYGHTLKDVALPSELHIYDRDEDRKTIFIQSLRNEGIDIDKFLDVSDSKTKREREAKIQTRLGQFATVKRELLDEQEIINKYSENIKFLSIYRSYQKALFESGGIDFDDILVYAHKILLDNSWCGDIYRAKYKHICVDEAQDLNKSQYEFIKVLCGEKIQSVMMVGDPNQMIYGFNGSSNRYLLQNFLEDFSPTQYVLSKNFRSSKAVVNLANKIKQGSQSEYDFALEGRSEIKMLDDENSEAIWICNKIDELIQEKSNHEIEGDISLDKMVVIARNRFVFKTLEKHLKSRGINPLFNRGERQVEPSSTFGKVLDLAIRVRLNKKDWVDGKKLCTVLKIDSPDVWDDECILSKFAKNVLNTDIPIPDIQSKLLLEIQNLDINDPNIPKLCKCFAQLIEERKNETLNEFEENELERSLIELQEFKECWQKSKILGLGSLSSFRNAMALGQLNGNNGRSGLTLSTVHTMKGLEKDIVFLMGMCEGVFPDYRARSEQELEEEKNNAFVAVTRAKRWIYITFPRLRKMPWGDSKVQHPSRFIRDMQG